MLSRSPCLRHGALIMLSLVAAACNPASPKGQVIATVDGIDVTVAELNEEARASGQLAGRDKAVRDALIEQLIQRKLLVREAIARKLDRSPQYLLAQRRQDEILLAQQLLSDDAASGGSVTDPQLRQFIAAHPAKFGERASITVDQIAMPAAPDARLRQALEAAPSVEAMAELIAAAGIKGMRGRETWDSASLAPGVDARRFVPGKSFVLPGAGGFVAGKVVAVSLQPVPDEQRLAVARQWIDRARAEQAMANVLARARSTARIDYQPQFAPEGPR